MKHYAILPKETNSVLSLPGGLLWLYNLPEETQRGFQEYKVYLESHLVWSEIRKIEGVRPAAIYQNSRLKMRVVARDYIVKSFACQQVLKLLGWDGTAHPPIEN